MAPWQQQFLEQSAVKVTHTLTHFLQSQCNELKFKLQLNNWTTNLYIPDPYSTDNLVYAAKKSKRIQWDNGITTCSYFGHASSAMIILTQLIVLLPQGSVVTSLQEVQAFRTAFHTCCSHKLMISETNTQLQKHYHALQLCCFLSRGMYSRGLLVWWRHLGQDLSCKISCRTLGQHPRSAQQETHKPTAVARVTFSLHQGANKKKPVSNTTSIVLIIR